MKRFQVHFKILIFGMVSLHYIISGVFMLLEAAMNLGVTHAIFEECVFANLTLFKCTDGNDLIPRSFLPHVGADIR